MPCWFPRITVFSTAKLLYQWNKISVRREGPRKDALDHEEKPATGCVERTSVGSVVALMDTTVRSTAFLRPNIDNHVILFILRCICNSVNCGTKGFVTWQPITYAPREQPNLTFWPLVITVRVAYSTTSNDPVWSKGLTLVLIWNGAICTRL